MFLGAELKIGKYVIVWTYVLPRKINFKTQLFTEHSEGGFYLWKQCE